MVLLLLSVAVGAKNIPLATVLAALAENTGQGDAYVVWDLRVPLADPGILGVNAGAAVFVAVAIALLGVTSAMDATGVTPLSGRLIDELSGGQRQRVWVAMALAQETEILLLDEPTTFLDIAHQIELMELFTDLHRSGRTLVAVLHDLNQAARYGTHLIAMKDGAVIAEGPPAEVVNAELVEHVFGLACWVLPDPVSGTPSVVPLGRDRGSRRG